MEITSQDLCMYVVIYCSLARSGRVICIARIKVEVSLRDGNLSEGKTIYWL